MTSAIVHAERIDGIIADIIERRDLRRSLAQQCRDRAAGYDREADELNAEMGDWNAIRAAAIGVTLVPVGVPAMVAAAADRILEPGATS